MDEAREVKKKVKAFLAFTCRRLGPRSLPKGGGRARHRRIENNEREKSFSRLSLRTENKNLRPDASHISTRCLYFGESQKRRNSLRGEEEKFVSVFIRFSSSKPQQSFVFSLSLLHLLHLPRVSIKIKTRFKVFHSWDDVMIEKHSEASKEMCPFV